LLILYSVQQTQIMSEQKMILQFAG